MKVFGEGWREELERTETPIGHQCIDCGETIRADDLGVIMPFLREEDIAVAVYHRACLLRALGLQEAHGAT